MSDGRIGNSNQTLQISGVVSAPAYSFASDNDSGMYRIGANNIGLGVNGAKVLDIATTGLSVTGALSVSGATTLSAALTYGGVTLSNSVTGTGSMVLSASPTFTGTVTVPSPFTLGSTSVTSTGTQLNYLNAATGTTGTTSSNLVFSASPSFSGTVNMPAGGLDYWRIANATLYGAGFGYTTSYQLDQIATSWPGFAINNTSDERLKNLLGDKVDYLAGAKLIHERNLITDFEVFTSPEKDGKPAQAFGLSSAQKFAEVFAHIGVRPPDAPLSEEELAMPEDKRRRVNEYWSASSEPFGLLALKIACAAVSKLEEAEARIAALEAK